MKKHPLWFASTRYNGEAEDKAGYDPPLGPWPASKLYLPYLEAWHLPMRLRPPGRGKRRGEKTKGYTPHTGWEAFVQDRATGGAVTDLDLVCYDPESGRPIAVVEKAELQYYTPQGPGYYLDDYLREGGTRSVQRRCHEACVRAFTEAYGACAWLFVVVLEDAWRGYPADDAPVWVARLDGAARLPVAMRRTTPAGLQKAFESLRKEVKG